jgi:PKD repeat protein
MRRLLLLCLLSLVATNAWINMAHSYARVLVVEVYASSSAKVNEEVNVTAYIHTGNNVRERVTEVQAMLILPEDVYLTSGANPVFIGTMGPGPADAYCSWTFACSLPGVYAVSVNVSCVDTQNMDRWLMNSTTIEVYDVPHVEFTYEGSSLYANETVVFNATDSHANALGGWIVSYEWSFGDGAPVTVYESVIEHVFQSVGDHEVSLNVTDSRGLSNITSTLSPCVSSVI